MDDARIAAIVNLEQLALPFAQGEADLYFAAPGHTPAAAPGRELDLAVRTALSRTWAHGVEAAIWVNHDDAKIVERSGANAAVNPEPLFDATWHRSRVVFTNFVAAGSVWVAGRCGHADVLPGRCGQANPRFRSGSRRCAVRRGEPAPCLAAAESGGAASHRDKAEPVSVAAATANCWPWLGREIDLFADTLRAIVPMGAEPHRWLLAFAQESWPTITKPIVHPGHRFVSWKEGQADPTALPSDREFADFAALVDARHELAIELGEGRMRTSATRAV